MSDEYGRIMSATNDPVVVAKSDYGSSFGPAPSCAIFKDEPEELTGPFTVKQISTIHLTVNQAMVLICLLAEFVERALNND